MPMRAPPQGSLLQGLLALVAPPACLGCDLPLSPRAPDAQDERDGSRCGGIPAGFAEGFCEACGPLVEPAPAGMLPPAAAAAVYRYEGPLADAIRRFKYGGAGELAAPLGKLLQRASSAYAGSIDCVLAVPLHPRKLRERGYNPAALLARPVARELGVPQRFGWLMRARATGSQAGLARDARQANVRRAFVARPAAPARVLLVDDVRTTGATLAEAAQTLATQGHQVFTLALAFAAK